MRDADFDNVTVGTHGIALSGNTWILSGTSDSQDQFTRQLTVTDVDSDTKKVESAVDWQFSPSRSSAITLVTYLANWVSAVVSDWSNPSQETSVGIAGNQNGWKIQVQGDYAYVVRNNGNPDFVVFDISDPSNPSVTDSLNLPGAPRNIVVSGNYAYIASIRNAQELQVVDISSPSSVNLVGRYNAPGRANANGIFVEGTTVYLSRSASNDDEFFVIDVSTPASPSLIGSENLGSDTNYEVSVVGNYAYVVSADNAQELRVVDISSPSSPSLTGSYNFSGDQNALTIATFGATAVIGRSNGGLFIMDISSPNSPSEIGSFDAQSSVQDISLGNSNAYAFLASNENSAEFQVVDISSPSTPSLVGSLNLSADLNGIAYHANKDTVFAVGDSNSEEFIVITP